MRAVLCLLLLTGCQRLLGLEPLPVVGDAAVPPGDGDASIGTDVSSTSGDGGTSECFGKYGAGNAGLLRVCAPATMAYSLSATIDTDNDPRCIDLAQAGANAPQVCAIVGTNVVIGNTYVYGTRPLVVVGRDALTVAGTLDVVAGGNWTGCSAALANGFYSGGGSGGAGGSFGGTGGTGGTWDNASGGTAGLTSAPSYVRGGCPGGVGGGGTFGGNSGGALYLISKVSVNVLGKINASGLGGSGGLQNPQGGFGGGGGGSGGFVGIDAPSVQLGSSSVVIAVDGGGGGGGGAYGVNGSAGGRLDIDNAPASSPAGGTRGLEGQDGANGAGGPQLDGGGLPATGTPGGGGGGGGGGVIKLYGVVTSSGARLFPLGASM